MLLSHGPSKAFLIPDSCRSMVRNGNNICTDMIEDILENNLEDASFVWFF